MDCTCERCGEEFARTDSLARHLRRRNPCVPALEMDPAPAPQLSLDKLSQKIDNLSQRFDVLVGLVCSEKDGGDEDDSDDEEDEDESEDEAETIPTPTKNTAVSMYTEHIGKHAKDLHALASAGPRRSRRILANGPPSLYHALGDVAQLVLDREIGIPAKYHAEANAHKEDIQEFADVPIHKKKKMLQTGSGIFSILAPLLGAVAVPLLQSLAG